MASHSEGIKRYTKRRAERTAESERASIADDAGQPSQRGKAAADCSSNKSTSGI